MLSRKDGDKTFFLHTLTKRFTIPKPQNPLIHDLGEGKKVKKNSERSGRDSKSFQADCDGSSSLFFYLGLVKKSDGKDGQKNPPEPARV